MNLLFRRCICVFGRHRLCICVRDIFFVGGEQSELGVAKLCPTVLVFQWHIALFMKSLAAGPPRNFQKLSPPPSRPQETSRSLLSAFSLFTSKTHCLSSTNYLYYLRPALYPFFANQNINTLIHLYNGRRSQGRGQ